MRVIRDKAEASKKTSGSSLGGYINITYPRLVSILGEPTFDTPSGDNKVQKEWVVEYNGGIFTIYDWKTYDVDYTMTELGEFNVGGRTNANDFIEALLDKNKE
jgi:hypothetical protein